MFDQVQSVEYTCIFLAIRAKSGAVSNTNNAELVYFVRERGTGGQPNNIFCESESRAKTSYRLHILRQLKIEHFCVCLRICNTCSIRLMKRNQRNTQRVTNILTASNKFTYSNFYEQQLQRNNNLQEIEI